MKSKDENKSKGGPFEKVGKFIDEIFDIGKPNKKRNQSNQLEQLVKYPENQDDTRGNWPSSPEYDEDEERIINKVKNTSYSGFSSNKNITSPQNLILLIFAEKENGWIEKLTLESLDKNNCEKIYEFSQYICMKDDYFLEELWNNIKQFEVEKLNQSKDDLFLVKLHLKDKDSRFNPRINQVDRIRAFRELPNLVDDIIVSPRLRLEAGKLFNLYHR